MRYFSLIIELYADQLIMIGVHVIIISAKQICRFNHTIISFMLEISVFSK